MAAAGEFGDWLRGLIRALKSDRGMDVPCGSCTACCRSGRFIHIRPQEKAALAAIPKRYLSPAPGLPGHRILGHFENGHCPMFRQGACSIYDQRPLACRQFDCRLYAAAGLGQATADMPLVAEKVRRWRFSYAGNAARRLREQLRAQAKAQAAKGHPPARAVLEALKSLAG